MKRKSAFYQLVFHFNWATKNREPMLTPAVEGRLIPYIAGKCKELGYQLHAVNGTQDHLHILLSLSPTVPVAEASKMLKGASSHYINNESGLGQALYWQDGYGVVSVSGHDIPIVCDYIRRQKEHHQVGSLIEEFERIESG